MKQLSTWEPGFSRGEKSVEVFVSSIFSDETGFVWFWNASTFTSWKGAVRLIYWVSSNCSIGNEWMNGANRKIWFLISDWSRGIQYVSLPFLIDHLSLQSVLLVPLTQLSLAAYGLLRNRLETPSSNGYFVSHVYCIHDTIDLAPGRMWITAKLENPQYS